jgi:hypothetical protein
LALYNRKHREAKRGYLPSNRYGRAFKNYAKKPFHQRVLGKGSLFWIMWLIKSSQGTAILGMLDKCGLSQKYLRFLPGWSDRLNQFCGLDGKDMFL